MSIFFLTKKCSVFGLWDLKLIPQPQHEFAGIGENCNIVITGGDKGGMKRHRNININIPTYFKRDPFPLLSFCNICLKSLPKGSQQDYDRQCPAWSFSNIANFVIQKAS